MKWLLDGRKKISGLTSIMAIALVIGMALPAVSQDKMNISFGGSSPGGMMYYLVGAASSVACVASGPG